MRRKIVITLIVLGILLFGLIMLHVFSAFSSFTLWLKEEQYEVLVSDAILALALVFALSPLVQVSKKKVKELGQVSNSRRKVEPVGANVLIAGNRCFRCGYEWRAKNIAVVSSICPACKSPYWNRPRLKRRVQG